MNDRIFHDGLQQKGRNRNVIHVRIMFDNISEMLRIHDLVHFKIHPDILDLIYKRTQASCTLQILPEYPRQTLCGMTGLHIVVQLCQSADGFQRIEQKVRIDLRL